MELKTKLSLLYSLITASVIMVFAVFIYLSAKQNRETEFYKVLNKEAITKVKLFLEAEVDDEILKEIYQSNKEIIDEVQVAIYDEAFNLIYHDDQSLDVVKENNEMLAQIVAENNISFYTDNWQVVGLLYSYNDKSYIVTATAYDQYGFNKLSSLLTTLVISFFISLVIVFLLGRFFAEQALLPIRNMNEQIKKITANSLDLRLVENESKDELAKLSTTFNEMLNRLEDSFDAQKQFVSNISHELRTPLSAIITELEISSNRERSIAQYKEVISLCLKDAKKMTRLSNSLLDLAKASYDPTEISFKNTRVDEVIIEAASDLKRIHKNFDVKVEYDESMDDQSTLEISANEYLLKVAFFNLMENACKFSDGNCLVSIKNKGKKLQIKIIDFGSGISKKNQEKIFSPFFRSKSHRSIEGHGIGLHLCQKIIHLHKGSIEVASKKKKGTTFSVRL